MKPLILITNDDGILSPGLQAAAQAVSELGDILIVAPRFQQTSMSRAFPKGENIGIIEKFELKVNGANVLGYGVHGSPAHAVSHAVLELSDRKPSLCVSGINYGENVGLSILASGTIGAAFEAHSYNIPGIAINVEASICMQHSCEYGMLAWEIPIYFTRMFAERVLAEGLPPEIALLNINIPSNATDSTPVRLTSLSRQDYFVFTKPAVRDFSKPFNLNVEVDIDEEKLEAGSDIKAFGVDRVVSVTPITWNLTAQTGWKLDP